MPMLSMNCNCSTFYIFSVSVFSVRGRCQIKRSPTGGEYSCTKEGDEWGRALKMSKKCVRYFWTTLNQNIWSGSGSPWIRKKMKWNERKEGLLLQLNKMDFNGIDCGILLLRFTFSKFFDLSFIISVWL